MINFIEQIVKSVNQLIKIVNDMTTFKCKKCEVNNSRFEKNGQWFDPNYCSSCGSQLPDKKVESFNKATRPFKFDDDN